MQLDVLVLGKHAEGHQHRKEPVRRTDARLFQDVPSQCDVFAVPAEQVTGLEHLPKAAGIRIQTLEVGRPPTRHEMLEPRGSQIGEAGLSLLVPVPCPELLDRLLGIGEKPVGTELEIEPVREKRPHHRGLVIRGRVPWETKGGHGFQIDPFLFGVEHLPQLLDVDVADQGAAPPGDGPERFDHLVPAHGQVQPRLSQVGKATGGEIDLPVVLGEQSQPLLLDLKDNCT